MTVVGTAVADSSGNYTVTTSVLADGNHALSLTATDTAGNESAARDLGTWGIDTAAPAAPATPSSIGTDTGVAGDRITSANTLTIVGTAEPGSTVKVYDGATVVGTAVADSSGNYTVTTSVLADGNHALSLTATDTARNEGADTGIGIWAVDTTAPAVPATPTSIGTDTNIAGDRITSDNTLTISGTAEPGSTVKVYDGTTVVGTAVADSSGNYTVTTSLLADGNHPLSLTATDSSGNESAARDLGMWGIDTTPPAAPPTPSSIGTDTGVPDDKITSDNTLTVNGTGQPGTEIIVYDGNVIVGSGKVDAEGRYSVTTLELGNGSHPLTIRAKDVAGVESTPTSLGTWVTDTVAPAAPSLPSIVSRDTGSSEDAENFGVDHIVNSGVIIVEGFSEAGATVKIFDGLKLVGITKADVSGKYALTTSALGDGIHSLSISATDIAGTESARTDIGTWLIDSVVPAKATILSYGLDTGITGDGFTSANDLRIRGSAEPGSLVTIFDGSVVLDVVEADRDGNWELASTGNLGLGKHDFNLRVMDVAGNETTLNGTLALNIVAPLTGTNAQSSYSFTVGREVDELLGIEGGSGIYDFRVTGGTLPAGINLDPVTGKLSGVPQKLADTDVQVTIRDSRGENLFRTIRIKVISGQKPLVISSGIGAATNVGQIPEGQVNNSTFAVGTAVTLYDTTDFKPSSQVVPFVGYTGEVRVALEDIEGDGRPEVIAAAGAGAQPHVRVIDPETGISKLSFLAFDPAYKGGLFVNAADVTGDGTKDIVISSGLGVRSHIKIFDGSTGLELASFYAFEEGFKGGSTVAVGDTDGDGVAEIVVGKGPGSEPLVRIFEQKSDGWSQRSEFLAFERFFRGGVYVAIGDIGGDGRTEIAVGANAGAGAAVAIFNAKTTEHIDQFYAYGQVDGVGGFRGGVRVAIEDYNRDGKADLITGAGPGSYPHLRVWDLTDLSQIASLLVAEDNYKGGVNLG